MPDFIVSTGTKIELAKANGKTQIIPAVCAVSTFSTNRPMVAETQLKAKPKRIIINHGEVSKSLDLASALYKLQRVETNVPRNLETVRLRKRSYIIVALGRFLKSLSSVMNSELLESAEV